MVFEGREEQQLAAVRSRGGEELSFAATVQSA
jgi:hypothetical protein